AEQRHQPDLEIHVVGESAQPHRRERTEGAERQRQQNRQRQRPFFVLCSEDQEHHQGGERQRYARGSARSLLLERSPAPVIAEVGRQHLVSGLFHGLGRLSGGVVRGG